VQRTGEIGFPSKQVEGPYQQELCSSLQWLAVLIPAWRPDPHLVRLVEELRGRNFSEIVVVDDGSGGGFEEIFLTLDDMPGVTILRHQENMGKGCALKTGFAYLLSGRSGVAGVVTADADGQHRPEDIGRVGSCLLQSHTDVVLGARDFKGNVPWRSRVGNTMTRYLFSVLTAQSPHDTQTGLRGLRRDVLPLLLCVPGARYEFEMRMLVCLYRAGFRVTELPIATVYEDGNRTSHFRPVRDSARIYTALLAAGFAPLRARYCWSLMCAAVRRYGE
jgi:glycosyltransferase involved in cell wall biosynthesis